MTDVMLMMAEAYAFSVSAPSKCRNIVDAIQKRNMLDQKTGLSATADNNKDKCIKLVMKERLIEFLGEGKRWFDLVRYAERIGGGTNPDPREPQYTDGATGVAAMVKNIHGQRRITAACIKPEEPHQEPLRSLLPHLFQGAQSQQVSDPPESRMGS